MKFSFVLASVILHFILFRSVSGIHSAESRAPETETDTLSGLTVMQVAFLPWDETAGLPWRQVPGANLGVTSFEIIDSETIAFLADATNEIIVYNLVKQNITGRIPVESAPRDFVYNSGKFYVLMDGKIISYGLDGKETLIERLPPELKGIMRIDHRDGETLLLHPSGNSLKFSKPSKYRITKDIEGWPVNNHLSVKAEINRSNSFELTWVSEGDPRVSTIYKCPEKPAGVFIIGMTGNYLALDVQSWLSENPVSVKRELVFIKMNQDHLGEVRYRIQVPDQYYVLTNKDFTIGSDGHLYHMVTSPEGVFVFKITEAEAGSVTDDYPGFLKRKKYHFNDHLMRVDTIENPEK